MLRVLSAGPGAGAGGRRMMRMRKRRTWRGMIGPRTKSSRSICENAAPPQRAHVGIGSDSAAAAEWDADRRRAPRRPGAENPTCHTKHTRIEWPAARQRRVCGDFDSRCRFSSPLQLSRNARGACAALRAAEARNAAACEESAPSRGFARLYASPALPRPAGHEQGEEDEDMERETPREIV